LQRNEKNPFHKNLLRCIIISWPVVESLPGDAIPRGPLAFVNKTGIARDDLFKTVAPIRKSRAFNGKSNLKDKVERELSPRLIVGREPKGAFRQARAGDFGSSVEVALADSRPQFRRWEAIKGTRFKTLRYRRFGSAFSGILIYREGLNASEGT
jgi:hypothetical protein